MTVAGDDPPDAFADALIAARLCAIDPGLGGMILRGGHDARDAVVAALRAGLPDRAAVRRIPAHIDDERLLGGIDLGATLASGHPVESAGLLAEADGGMVVVPMAERLPEATAGRLAAAIDAGDTRFLTVALDDGLEPDERVPAALAERVAFWVDLTTLPYPSELRSLITMRHPASSDLPGSSPAHSGVLEREDVPEDVLRAFVGVAAALGVDSARATLFALRAARAMAQLSGRESVTDADVALASRLVLAPRATRLPVVAEDDATPEPPPSPEPAGGEKERGELGQLDDVVLAAALAAIPKDLLAQLAAGRGRAPAKAHGAGERRKSPVRGRPMSARAGMPGGGQRLALIDTLRAAAPWQKLRGGGLRVQVRRDDLRIRRFEARAEAVTIFAVDASGSSALARLAEAKGAVELLLAEAYVKRAQVALVAFRGTSAELLLPPTRSLTRARRSLADLPGGGGTPLAAGLNAARELAQIAKARGRTPFIVVLTDGRANVAADGSTIHAVAEADAAAAAGAIGAAGIAAAFVDISARPRAEGATLAAAMRARYLPLPRADAATMHAAISTAQRG